MERAGLGVEKSGRVQKKENQLQLHAAGGHREAAELAARVALTHAAGGQWEAAELLAKWLNSVEVDTVTAAEAGNGGGGENDGTNTKIDELCAGMDM